MSSKQSTDISDKRRKEYKPQTDFQTWVKPRLEARGWLYTELARQLVRAGLDVTENYVYRVVRGDPERSPNARRPGYEIAFAIGQVFGDIAGAVKAAGYPWVDAPVDPFASFAVEIDPSPFIAALNNPIEVSAAPGREIMGETTEGEHLSGPLRTMLIRGECMEPVLRDGDIIFVQPAETVRNDDLVIALVDGMGQTCKRICIPDDETLPYLEPINGEGRIAESRFLIQGVVTHVIENVRHRIARYQAAHH
ncbi:LexA family protein [Armatimonas sp.]|uniref:LexA family protein n=1 Tax=Armatimonas sp. TaxID=1872638 RepID=UPI003751B3A2